MVSLSNHRPFTLLINRNGIIQCRQSRGQIQVGLEAGLAIGALLMFLGTWGVSSVVSRFLGEPEPKREPGIWWVSAHTSLHGKQKDCTPCLNSGCKHSCREHELLKTSHDQRHLCHVRGCACMDFEQLIVKGFKKF